MNNKFVKWVYGILFGCFIAVGLAMLIFGFIKLAQYKSAEEIDATVISAEYDFENREIDVSFAFELNGEQATTSAHFYGIEYVDGRLPYHNGAQTKIRVTAKKQIAVYGKKEIILTVGGSLFFLAGCGFLYFAILRKSNLFDLACDYENAMVSPEELSDDTAKYEAVADQLSKLPVYNAERLAGETEIAYNRLTDRLKTFTPAEHIVCSLILVGLIAVFWTVCRLGVFGIFCGLFVFGFGGLLLKALYGTYIKILVKLGKFSEKKFATVTVCAFESQASFQTGSLSRNHIVFKKFRVVATIDGKRSIGYVYGNTPPPKGCILKVLVRPKKFRRFIIDNNKSAE
ncbi:MAG: hypothetical protein K2N23_00480 [Clostridia bacterium]|nr:hypothetical protein [Clostridia bacterium]